MPIKQITLVEAAPATSVPKPVEQILNELGFSDQEVGYAVFDLEKKQFVAIKNPDRSFLPASVNKLGATLAALNILGANYRFRTTLSYRGKIKSGLLVGDLYLKGNGDPMLTISNLMDLALQLRRRGIQNVSGHFYYDATFLPHQTMINESFEVDAPYNSGISALSAEFNRFRLRWQPSSQPGTLNATIIPASPALHVSRSLQGQQFSYSSEGDQETWTLPLNLRREGERELPVKNASRYTAGLFANLAHSIGLTLPSPEEGMQPATAMTLATHESEPLLKLVKADLEYSNNLMTELFVLQSGHKLSGKTLSLVDSVAKITTWLKTSLTGVNWDGYKAENGSGLSPNDRLTPAQAVGILNWADGLLWGGESYMTLLPVSGYRGTLRERLTAPDLAFRVWAKTGTINYGSGLAGYFLSSTNHKFSFALFLSDFEKRRLVDQVPPDQFAVKNVDGWIERARKAQDSILSKWILDH